MLTDLLLNAFIVILLSVTIVYCWMLNRRIKVLQDSRGELALLLNHFDDSTRRASESIIGLQTASKKIGENIQSRIEMANSLIDDLAYMTEKAEKAASKLEASFAVNRARERVMSEQPTMRPVKVEVPVEELSEKAVSQREKTSASLEAVLERVAGRSRVLDENTGSRNGSSSGWPPVQKPERTRQRSKAEQELLDMIKTGIRG